MIKDIANKYYSYGLSVVPVSKDKLPTIAWKQRQSELIKPNGEFNNVDMLAIIGGAVSGGLECIDLDLKYDITGTLMERYKALVKETDGNLLKRLVVEKSQNNGYHFIYRYNADKYEGNLKLASRPTTEAEKEANPKEKVKVLLETRGEGGYFVAAPSAGYNLVQGGFDAVPTLTLAERNVLISCARALNEYAEEVVKPVYQPKEKTDGLSPFDDYNERGDVLTLLLSEGWTIAKENSKNYFLKRDGSDSKWGATLHKETRTFYVFSTSTQFESNKGYAPATVYGVLKHNKDWSACAKSLLESGYGEAIVYENRREVSKVSPAPTAEETKSMMQKMYEESFIDVSKKLDYPKVAISIGDHTISGTTYPTAFGTYGNFSCLVGASKSKKTFFKSLLVSCYIGGQADRYSETIRGHRKGNEIIIDVDTEQGDWHAQNTFKRIPKMVGGNPDFYKPFALRPYSHLERIQFIEYLIYESEFKNNTGLFVIDGIADLVADFNDLKESNAIIQKIMKWTDDKKFHLISIVHQNSTTQKATGHLGSSILKKAETVCNLVALDNNEVEVTFSYTRGFPIPALTFRINDDGLPTMLNSVPQVQMPQQGFKRLNNFRDYTEPLTDDTPF